MQKHRPNRQVRRWVAARQLGGIVRLILNDFVKLPQSFFVMQKMTAPSKMGRKHELNLISYRRDRARPCPQQTNENKTIIGCYQIEKQMKLRLPLTGNICDRRLWRIKGASVGAAVDFVRRSKPHKQNRDTARGQ